MREDYSTRLSMSKVFLNLQCVHYGEWYVQKGRALFTGPRWRSPSLILVAVDEHQ